MLTGLKLLLAGVLVAELDGGGDGFEASWASKGSGMGDSGWAGGGMDAPLRAADFFLGIVSVLVAV